MRLTLTLRERDLLEHWLPHESKLGEDQTDARSLVAALQDPLTPADVLDRLAKVRRHLAEFRETRSLLDHRAPLGRGHQERLRSGGTIQWLSPWERAWLAVDHLRGRGKLRAPSEEDLKSIDPYAFYDEVTPLCPVAIAILCLADAREGAELAATVAADDRWPAMERTWLHWLATGDSSELATALDHDMLDTIPEPAMRAALRGQWDDAEGALVKFQSGRTRKLQANGKMLGKHLAQLVAHARTQKPSRAIVEASLGVVMHAVSLRKRAEWWESTDVRARLPLLAVHARVFGHAGPGAVLLHAQRVHNEHIAQPPPRTFDTPREVIEALEKLAQILVAAADRKSGLRISLGERSVYELTGA